MFYIQYLVSLLSTHKQRVYKEGKRREMVCGEEEGYLWEIELKKGKDEPESEKVEIWRGQ